MRPWPCVALMAGHRLVLCEAQKMQDCLLFIALRRVTGDDDVSSPDTRHSVPHTLHHGCGLVAQDTGKETLGVVTVQGVDVRVTESIADDLRGQHYMWLTLLDTHLDSDLSRFGRRHLDISHV